MGQWSVSEHVPESYPAWLVWPYADYDSCWGCGLEPEVDVWDLGPTRHFCRYCNDLRTLILEVR